LLEAKAAARINREIIHKYLIKQREEKWLSGTFGGKSEKKKSKEEILRL
jgi:hypothetical protein